MASFYKRRFSFSLFYPNPTKLPPLHNTQNQSLSFSNDDAIHWNSYLDRKRAETAEAAAILDFRKPAAILNENGNRSTWDESASLFSQQRSDQDVVIIYNRVPKTGSTTFANVLYTLCKTTNNCTVVYVRAERNAHIYSLGDQVRTRVKISS